MSTVLIAFYSRGGNTRRVAERARRALEDEGRKVRIWEGKPVRPPSFVRAAFGALLGLPMPVHRPESENLDFDVAIIGGPVWANTAAPPVLDMVWQLAGALEGKKAVPFCTCERGPGKAPRALARSLATAGARASAPVVVVFKGGAPAEDLAAVARKLAGAVAGGRRAF